MFEESLFPDWLEACLVQDDVFGDAYEAAMPERRAWLKTAIARLHVLYGASGMTWGRSEKQWRQGFVSVAESRPVDWTVFLLAGDYSSGPRSVAALMPALFAGVPHVLVARVADVEAPWADPVLAGFELAGQEAVVSLPQDRITSLLADMKGKGSGRVVVLGAVPAAITETVLAFAAANAAQIACWVEPSPATLVVADGGDSEELDEGLLSWAHPDLACIRLDEERLALLREGEAELPFASDTQGPVLAFAGSSDCIDVVPDFIPLMIGPGQEGCWVWPELEPGFFMQRRLTLVTEI
ncbi:hypothetical protein N1030_05290 [Desulfovibrio mangrovi]|uniref:hypothetical protein n=1 Tax=Desulfovibrio mangrovi TaxID=2976983 RepID=UPI002247B496|nr:hypothetical protein [Desulfovibrio mangrovi]UZP68393.1 hypothetical protein N1030_05290 [Desulfovibrio mangrovi]